VSALPELRNPAGERLAATYVPGRAGSRALVVIGHGLTSDRERPWSQALSAGLAEHGIASLRLAFSGNGDSEGRFEDSNPSKEVLDLGAVLDAFSDRRLAYVGHSMGGAVGLMRAVGDERITALVSLAGIAHPRAFVERLFGHLVPGEVMLGKPHCRLSATFVEDMTRLDTLAPLAPRVEVPWLLVHGDADEIVPHGDSLDLWRAAGERPELVVLEGADHSFTGEHLVPMVERVVSWLVGHVGAVSG
jgi:pimeloyl-ACP methyl ester carboxylesterase